MRFDERLASPDQMKSAVQGAGYGVGVTDAPDDPETKGGCCGG